MKLWHPMLICAVLAGLAPPASADTVMMVNGDRLTGTVVTMEDGTLLLSTDYAGEVRLEWTQVAEVWLDQPLPARLKSGEDVEVCQLPEAALSLDDVDVLAPQLEPVRWTGRVALGYAKTGGNSSAFLGTMAARAAKNVPDKYDLILLFDAARGQSDGEDTANRAAVQGKYTRGRGAPRYAYYLTGFGYDRLRDIDLRTEIGAGFGRPLIEKPANLLTVEAGLSWVSESYADGSSSGDIRIRVGEGWARQLGLDTSLRQTVSALAAASDPADIQAEFSLSLTHHLNSNLSLITSLIDTYYTRPAEGTERNDYTLTTQLGYGFGQ